MDFCRYFFIFLPPSWRWGWHHCSHSRPLRIFASHFPHHSPFRPVGLSIPLFVFIFPNYTWRFSWWFILAIRMRFGFQWRYLPHNAFGTSIRIILIRIIGIISIPIFLITSPILLIQKTVILLFWILDRPTTYARLLGRQFPQFDDSVLTAPKCIASLPFLLSLPPRPYLFLLCFNFILLVLNDFT